MHRDEPGWFEKEKKMSREMVLTLAGILAGAVLIFGLFAVGVYFLLNWLVPSA